MAGVVIVGPMQRLVTEFLTAEVSNPIVIHRRLNSVYDEDAIGFWVRRWVGRFKSGEKDTDDRLCSHISDGGDKSQGLWANSG